MQTTTQQSVINELTYPAANITEGRLSNGIDSINFSDLVIAALRKRIPNGKFEHSVLAGCEDELRKEALILLMDRYLSGNERLRTAILQNDIISVKAEISKSTSAAVHVSYMRLRRKRYRLLYCEKSTVQEELSQEETSYQEIRNVVVSAIHSAFQDCKINERDKSLLLAIAADSLPAKLAARQLNISKSRLYRVLKRASKILPSYCNNVEIPRY